MVLYSLIDRSRAYCFCPVCLFACMSVSVRQYLTHFTLCKGRYQLISLLYYNVWGSMLANISHTLHCVRVDISSYLACITMYEGLMLANISHTLHCVRVDISSYLACITMYEGSMLANISHTLHCVRVDISSYLACITLYEDRYLTISLLS